MKPRDTLKAALTGLFGGIVLFVAMLFLMLL